MSSVPFLRTTIGLSVAPSGWCFADQSAFAPLPSVVVSLPSTISLPPEYMRPRLLDTNTPAPFFTNLTLPMMSKAVLLEITFSGTSTRSSPPPTVSVITPPSVGYVTDTLSMAMPEPLVHDTFTVCSPAARLTTAVRVAKLALPGPDQETTAVPSICTLPFAVVYTVTLSLVLNQFLFAA